MKPLNFVLLMVNCAALLAGCAGSTPTLYERYEMDKGQSLPIRITGRTASDTSAAALKEIDEALPWQLSNGYDTLFAITRPKPGAALTHPYGTGRRDTLLVPEPTLAVVTEIVPFIDLMVSPSYPRHLCNKDTVLVMVMDLVDSNGTVLKSVIIRSNDTLFNRPVLHAAMQWHFRWPATFRSSVPVWLSMPFIIPPRPRARADKLHR